MQQLKLLQENKKICLQQGNLYFEAESYSNYYIGILKIPSGNFLIKYSLEEAEIKEFEILDMQTMLYLNKGLIKNIKNLTQVIIKNTLR